MLFAWFRWAMPVVLLWGCSHAHSGETDAGLDAGPQRIACDDPACPSTHRCCPDFETGESYCCSGSCEASEERCFCADGPPCDHRSWCCPEYVRLGYDRCLDSPGPMTLCYPPGP